LHVHVYLFLFLVIILARAESKNWPASFFIGRKRTGQE